MSSSGLSESRRPGLVVGQGQVQRLQCAAQDLNQLLYVSGVSLGHTIRETALPSLLPHRCHIPLAPTESRPRRVP